MNDFLNPMHPLDPQVPDAFPEAAPGDFVTGTGMGTLGVTGVNTSPALVSTGPVVGVTTLEPFISSTGPSSTIPPASRFVPHSAVPVLQPNALVSELPRPKPAGLLARSVAEQFISGRARGSLTFAEDPQFEDVASAAATVSVPEPPIRTRDETTVHRLAKAFDGADDSWIFDSSGFPRSRLAERHQGNGLLSGLGYDAGRALPRRTLVKRPPPAKWMRAFSDRTRCRLCEAKRDGNRCTGCGAEYCEFCNCTLEDGRCANPQCSKHEPEPCAECSRWPCECVV